MTIIHVYFVFLVIWRAKINILSRKWDQIKICIFYNHLVLSGRDTSRQRCTAQCQCSVSLVILEWSGVILSILSPTVESTWQCIVVQDSVMVQSFVTHDNRSFRAGLCCSQWKFSIDPVNEGQKCNSGILRRDRKLHVELHSCICE